MIQLLRTDKVLALTGELTIFQAAEAKALFGQALAEGSVREVDLSGLLELDTAGVQLLLWLEREGRAKGQPLAFTHPSPAVLEAFDQLNLAGALGGSLLAPIS